MWPAEFIAQVLQGRQTFLPSIGLHTRPWRCCPNVDQNSGVSGLMSSTSVGNIGRVAVEVLHHGGGQRNVAGLAALHGGVAVDLPR